MNAAYPVRRDPPPAPSAYARVRVAGQALAIAADQVLQAGPWPTEGLLPVPRRGGALAGMCRHEGGLLPVVALDRWCPMGAAPEGATSAADRRLLVLRSGDAVVGLSADAVLGVNPAPASGAVRLHHADEEHELFQSAVMLAGEATCVLEVGRLTRLARVWADLATLDDTAAPEEAEAQRGHAGPLLLHAVLSAGGLLAALPVGALRQVVATPPLEIDFGRGAPVRGLCQWSQRKLPVLDLALRLGAPPADAALPRWMAVVGAGPAMAGLLIDEACRLLPLPAGPAGPAGDPIDLPPGLLPPVMTAMGAVRPLDAAALLAGLPMALPTGDVAAVDTTAAAPPRSPAHLVFEADGLYATPVEGIAAVVPLPADAAERLMAGQPTSLPWRGELLPLKRLPRYGGDQPRQPPALAVVVQPEHARPLALAIGRLVSWVPANTAVASGMRMAPLGDLQMISVGRAAAAVSWMVLDLAELAYLLD